MKKTIKEDQARLVLHQELLNDNSLLEIVADHGFMDVGVRFIESPTSGMKEHTLLHMDIVEYMHNKEELIEINEGKDAIAVFRPIGEEYQLEGVYDTIKHEFAYADFVDIVYQKKFPNAQLKGAYRKEKTKGG